MIIIGGYHQFITEKKFSALSIINIGKKGYSKETIANETNIFKRLMWNLRIESFLGISLLFVVSILANMVLPSGEIPSSTNITNYAETINPENQTKNSNIYSTVVYTDDQKIEINLQPARLGQNKILVYFTDYNNKPIDNISNATLKLSQLERNIGPIQIDMEKISNGRFNAVIPISTLGLWNLEIQGKTLQSNTPNTITIGRSI
jgi:copper transport protein